MMVENSALAYRHEVRHAVHRHRRQCGARESSATRHYGENGNGDEAGG